MKYPILLLLLTLVSCASEPNPPDYAAHTWIYDPAATTDTIFAGADLTIGSTITFTDSTAEISNPYRAARLISLPLRAAAPDSVKHVLSVEPVSGDVIRVTATTPTRTYSRNYYRRETAPDTVGLTELLGRSFRTQFPSGREVDFHFGTGDPGSKGAAEVPLLGAQYVAKDTGSYYQDNGVLENPLIFLQQDNGLRLHQLGLSQLLGLGGMEAYFTVHRSPDAGYALHYVTRHKNERFVGRVALEELPPVIPPEVPLSNVVNLLNGGLFEVDTEIEFPDSVGVAFAYEEDFRGVSLAEAERLDFLFSPEGDFVLFSGERQLRLGKWAIDPARRSIALSGSKGRTGPGGLPILSYTDEEMVFRYPLDILTPEPKGTKLLSYVPINARVTVRPR